MNKAAKLEERLVRYARVDTQSDGASQTVPTTVRQLDLARILVEELEGLGAEEVCLTEAGFVLATIPATDGVDAPTVAFLAHMDTASDYPAANVKPLVHRNYDGRPIALPGDPEKVLDETTAPGLSSRAGDTIITSDGTTLLGADNKAGVAIVMTLAEVLLSDRSQPHGRVRLCFTPDEETGTGIRHLRLEELSADIAYTLDGEGGRGGTRRSIWDRHARGLLLAVEPRRRPRRHRALRVAGWTDARGVVRKAACSAQRVASGHGSLCEKVLSLLSSESPCYDVCGGDRREGVLVHPREQSGRSR